VYPWGWKKSAAGSAPRESNKVQNPDIGHEHNSNADKKNAESTHEDSDSLPVVKESDVCHSQKNECNKNKFQPTKAVFVIK
jgi:hypothetical protein